jgi:hypothetical protein
VRQRDLFLASKMQIHAALPIPTSAARSSMVIFFSRVFASSRSVASRIAVLMSRV